MTSSMFLREPSAMVIFVPAIKQVSAGTHHGSSTEQSKLDSYGYEVYAGEVGVKEPLVQVKERD